jgi:hypothetical protein
MNTKKYLCKILLAMPLLLTGCAATNPSQTKAPEAVCFNQNLEKTMIVAEDVLTEMRFTIEKFDIQQGYIKTRPLAGKQLFEFWRSDNVGTYNSAEANLHSIIRQVEMKFHTKGQTTCALAFTNVKRLSLTEERLEGMERMAGIFTGGDADLQKLNIKNLENADWINLGPDHLLEKRIHQLIKTKMKLAQGKL